MAKLGASAAHWKEAARIDAQGTWGRAARDAVKGNEKLYAARPALPRSKVVRNRVKDDELARKFDKISGGQLAKPLQGHRCPSLRLVTGKRYAQGLSRLGGRPNLPKDVGWPVWNGEPLSFVAQLDLGALPKLRGLPTRKIEVAPE